MSTRVTVEIEDVGGSFARLIKQAPKIARNNLAGVVKETTQQLVHRMQARAPVGPDAPHIRDEQDVKVRGLVGQAGIIGNDEEAHIALYNEYSPNHQPFMGPAAEDEANPFKSRAIKALEALEHALGI